MKKSLFFIINLFMWCPLQASDKVEEKLEDLTITGPAKLEDTAKASLNIRGPAKLKKVKAISLDIMGPLDFEELTIANNTKIQGPAEGKEGKFSDLDIMGPLKASKIEVNVLKVMGPVKLEKSHIKGDADITGPLEAEDSQFQKITITMDKAELKDTSSKSIYIRKNTPDKVQKLRLKGKTMIDGTIEFESGKGIVKADKDVVIKGEIKGAEVKRK